MPLADPWGVGADLKTSSKFYRGINQPGGKSGLGEHYESTTHHVTTGAGLS
jgi:hypothetical protein